MRDCYRRITRALAGLRVLGRPDGMIVELTAWALADHARLSKIVRELGESYETTTENGSTLRRQRPEVVLTNQAWHRVVIGLRELGLSPTTRGRVVTLPPPALRADDDPLEDLRRRAIGGGPDVLKRFRRQHPRARWRGLLP